MFKERCCKSLGTLILQNGSERQARTIPITHLRRKINRTIGIVRPSPPQGVAVWSGSHLTGKNPCQGEMESPHSAPPTCVSR